MGTEFERA